MTPFKNNFKTIGAAENFWATHKGAEEWRNLLPRNTPVAICRDTKKLNGRCKIYIITHKECIEYRKQQGSFVKYLQ